MKYFDDVTFENADFSIEQLEKGEYDNCRFVHCNFFEADLAGISFSETGFTGSNLSMIKIAQTTFQDIKFKECKLLGIHFEDSSELLFKVDFDQCILNLSSFYKRNLIKTVFNSCSLQEVDFTEADLTQAVFHDCDLARAIFDHTILNKADLRTAAHYSIDPATNSIKKARFSMAGISGLLDKYDIEIE